jgi:hypothetical protein
MNGSDRKVVGVNWWTGENMGGRGSRQVSEHEGSKVNGDDKSWFGC